MVQASSFSSRAEDAPAVEVPAKGAGVHDSKGTKNMELMDPISSTKFASIMDDQLPSLFSMVIDGLPPLQQAKYVDEAEKRLHQYVERYPHVISMESYCRGGLSVASYIYPQVINVDRLVAMSFSYALLFLIDDLFFDTPDEFHLDQYGINQSACGSPENIQEYLDHLGAVLSQQVKPSNSAPLIETLMWESGRDMLELSNPEWLENYVACVIEHHHSSVASYVDILQGHNLYFKDLESYALMRAANVGGKFIQMGIELANNSYIPSILKTTPYFENITKVVSIHIGFVNDLQSYHKESLIEENPRNLITVMMECEGKPFVQTVHMAIDLTNTYARAIMDMEAEAWNPTLQKHLQDVKDLMAGNIYFGCKDLRYRQPDSIFPELRDMTSSWKVLPHAKGPGL